jgi:Endonuclease-reverse transcriptase
MNEHDSLRILQYNINHGKEATLIPLLQDTNVQNFDVLAIQEPWMNPFMNTSYNPSTTTFHLSYPPKPLARVCFYVNKRIDPSSWAVTTHNEDLQTLTIRYGPTEDVKTVKIHNIYNPSPQSYTAMVSGTLATLQECLREDTNDHILLGDFNLHHPHWGRTLETDTTRIVRYPSRYRPQPLARTSNPSGNSNVAITRHTQHDRPYIRLGNARIQGYQMSTKARHRPNHLTTYLSRRRSISDRRPS